MESKTTKSYRHCPGENYEISIFICKGRQKAHYPKCPTCEFRTKTDDALPTSAEKEIKEPPPPPPPPRPTNTGSIVVKSEPPSAEIYLDGDNIGVTPAIITQVLPDRYQVKIKMEGYEAWNESVDVKANKETSLTAILQGKDGSIVIESEPTNADIFIDGNNIDVTPVTIKKIKPGKYFIEVKLDGFETWSNEINVEAEKETCLTAELITEYGSIFLGSEPTKSRIFLDGIEIGTTPANLKSVPHGMHLIEVRKDGYNVWEKSVYIESGKEKVFTAILQVMTGSVSIKSGPKNAKIYLDGKYVGTTPERIESIIPGTHEIKVQMDEYDVWGETINIEAGKEHVITATLQRSTGSLMVESDPANATIFFDGKKIGTTPEIVMSGTKGTHTVEVRMKGYDLWAREVDIEPGTENTLTAILQLKTGSLNIKSTPPDAIIFINSEEAGPAPKTITKLAPGIYKVEVRMEGYESWSENVEISADKENHLTAVLQILTGSVIVMSEPSNAMVIVNGNEIGNTPVNLTDLEPGKHLVEISMDGYENWTENIEVSANKENQITAVLLKSTAALNINSEPSNAMTIVDGNEVGNTPANLTDLEPGKHLVEISMDGYENWTENVEISVEKENHITAVLRKSTAALNINSEPSNAMTTLDGYEVGNTPVSLTDLEPGKHLIEISMEGYEKWTENIEVSADKENLITAVLRKSTASLNIKSEPSNAMIIVDGNEIGNTPVNLTDLEPGKHLVEISMEGYERWTESVEIIPGKVFELTSVLQIIPGSFSINSEPSNAIVFIDSRDAGTTPLIITDPDQGKHLVEVKMEGYESWSENVDIEQGKETILTAVLQLKAGSLCIKSQPSNGVVLIDGKEVGITPLIITDPNPGTHNVEVKMDGYETWNESVRIETGKEAVLTAALQLKAGPVAINSIPSDAMILIDGKEIGKTPVNITDPSPGTYLVEVRLDGYKTWNKSVDIEPGKEITITADLKMKAGTVSINSEPSNAMVFIDGKKAGSTPETIADLTPGIHLVEVKQDGYETWSESVEVKDDKEYTLKAILLEITGSINISSNPSNAIIRIDNMETGNTPSIITNLSTGKHLLEVEMNGYELWSDSINTEPGKEITITAELQTKTGSVVIKSEPTNAMVLIDGEKAGSTPETLTNIKPGKHLVEIKMDGYIDWNESINIEPGMESDITAELQIKACTVSINSEPSNAMVLIDGERAGSTPEILTDIKPGKHIVEVRIDEYETWSKNIDIEQGMEIEISAELYLKVGSVIIKSEPTNAMILIDGIKAGKTPKILTDIKHGKHIVEVRMGGFETWSESVEVSGDKENVIVAVLKEMIGSISVNSNHSGAIIYLDGKEIGATPDTIKSVSIGAHVIKVKMEGYAEWTKKLNMKKGEEIALNAVLQSITGTVNVESEPKEAMILLDGKDVGKSPEIMTGIITGKHEVEVRMDGYISWIKMIKVKAGREYAYTAVLQKRKGSLLIISNPSNAVIYIQDKKIGKTPKTITELIPGNYTVEVKHEEYQTWSEKVEITSDKETTLEAILQAKPGSISIKSKPSGAIILIDGNESGTTPETINDIECGTHIVELKVDGYEAWSENVEVKANKESHLTATLSQITGSINIKSDPPHAIILIDGKNTGTTPASIKDLSLGTHTVDISMDGYNVWSESVEIEAKKDKELTAKLQEKKGSVNINSKPSGGLILFDSKEAGTTPKIITDLTAGEHLVEVSKEGYEHWSENIKVTAGKEYTMTAALQEITGSINVNSEPSTATILVDGNKAGQTPETIENLKPGAHQVEVRMDGFENWNDNVEVEAGKENKLTVTLQQLTCTVNINSKPPDATILIDNSEKGSTPQTIEGLNSGIHEIVIRMTGYQDWNESITVGIDKENKITALLQEITGSINIKSDPLNAMILIDGKKAGTTPAMIKDLSPGTHLINISTDGYADWKESIDVISGKEVDLIATLQMEVGAIDLKSKPSDAIIILDGKEVGTTPAVLSSIPVGPHEIEIKIDGYENWKRSIITKKGKENSLNAMLQLNIGSISIESYPEKAKIKLDGKDVGKTPKRLTDIITGTHEVEIMMDGYITWKKTIKIKTAKETSLTADLEKESDTIEIETDSTMKTPEIPEAITHEIRESKLEPEKGEEKPITPPETVEPPAIKKETNFIPEEIIKPRSIYDKISDSQIDSIPFITVREKNNSIFLCHSSIIHCYEEKPIGNGDVIIDHTTELMWYQSGSLEYFNLRKAMKWLKKANKDCYAGFSDWRLPTLEEASSLLEFEAKSDTFINPVFDNKQWGTWTGDKSDRGQAWIVTFVNGTISQVQAGTPATFIRPVRSLNI